MNGNNDNLNFIITALLPMKGHSERVPNKNMLMFAGRPLYHWVASILEGSSFVSTIVIDTDSMTIAKDATKFFSKVQIINRPAELIGDMISMNAIIEHDMAHCKSEHFLQTHSTNPLLKRDTLEQAIKEYFKSLTDHDSLFSVTPLQTRLYWETGKPVNHNPHELLRTQDLPPIYEENSNFYIFSKTSFAGNGNRRIGQKPKMFALNKLEAIDIDNKEDFLLAETLFKLNKEQH